MFTGLTPYEAVYVFKPPKLLQYVKGTTNLEVAEQELRSREHILAVLKHNLIKAQACMKNQHDKHHKHMQFEEGDYVYLKLQPDYSYFSKKYEAVT